MSEKKYHISKSGYTLKRRNPIITKDGTIYETDLSTTLKSHEYIDGKLITRTEGGFVFITNVDGDTPRSFNKTPTKPFEFGDLIGSDIPINQQMVSEESELLKNVKLSPSYINLSDYCYYGSANAMLKAEIDDMIVKRSSGSKDEFFNSLSDFQKILLNRDTTPIYKATFKIPIETDNGIEHVYKTFIHPSDENGDLDVKSTNYNIYLSSLIDATNLIDELYCDNLYRVMTHDSIKNFDSSYSKDDIEEYIIGGSKVNKVLRIYGRSFDDIKKYIDGVGTVNTITYNGENNIPKEYFYDTLSLKGWVPYNIAEHFNTNVGVEDASHELLRRFIINSPNIFRAKGTKKAISKVFSLFGIKEEWYKIHEIYQPVSGCITNSELKEIAERNHLIINNSQSIADGSESYTFDINSNMFKGINIKAKVECPECGTSECYRRFDGDTGKYITKCINGHGFELNDNLVGMPYHTENTYENYFQQKGGWYRETGGFHEDFSGESHVLDVPYGNNPHIGNGKYDDGYDYVLSYMNLFKRYDSPGKENEGVGFTLEKREIVENKIFTDVDGADLHINLKNILIIFDGDKIGESYSLASSNEAESFNPTKSFELVKDLTLPYIEQVVPSTTIFDMILKTTEPIWSYLDSYCELDENGNTTGNKVVRYQDMNPFSEATWANAELKGTKRIIDGIEVIEKGIVEKKFGPGFEEMRGMKIPVGSNKGYGNIHVFVGKSDDCPINAEPKWEIITDLIDSDNG